MQSPYNFNINIHILKSKISYRLENQFKIPTIMLTNNKNIFQIKHALHNTWNFPQWPFQMRLLFIRHPQRFKNHRGGSSSTRASFSVFVCIPKKSLWSEVSRKKKKNSAISKTSNLSVTGHYKHCQRHSTHKLMTSLLDDPLATLYAHLYEYVDAHVGAF